MKKPLSWLWHELDALVAIVLGIAFAVLGVLNVVQSDVLGAATLALLSVLAFAIVRERTSRERFVNEAGNVQESIAQIEEAVSSLRTGEPYRVLTHVVEWDLLMADGTFAVMRKRMRLRFLQNNVTSINDYALPDGRVSNETYVPGRKVDTFMAGGRRYALISLGRLMQAGDELDLEIYREVHDSFKDDHEFVSLHVLTPTDVLVMKLTWPKGRPPSNLRLERSTQTRDVSVEAPDMELKQLSDGRTTYSHVIDQPAEGTTISVFWDW